MEPGTDSLTEGKDTPDRDFSGKKYLSRHASSILGKGVGNKIDHKVEKVYNKRHVAPQLKITGCRLPDGAENQWPHSLGEELDTRLVMERREFSF